MDSIWTLIYCMVYSDRADENEANKANYMLCNTLSRKKPVMEVLKSSFSILIMEKLLLT